MTNDDLDTSENIYSTRDIYLAATLVSLGYEVIGVDFQVEGMRGRPIGYFNFLESSEIERTEKDYLHGKLKVEPRNLFTSFKTLKGIVQNAYKKPKI